MTWQYVSCLLPELKILTIYRSERLNGENVMPDLQLNICRRRFRHKQANCTKPPVFSCSVCAFIALLYALAYASMRLWAQQAITRDVTQVTLQDLLKGNLISVTLPPRQLQISRRIVCSRGADDNQSFTGGKHKRPLESRHSYLRTHGFGWTCKSCPSFPALIVMWIMLGTQRLYCR